MLDKQGYMHAHAHAPGHSHAHTHADKYVILTDFPRQQWLCERVSTFRYRYIDGFDFLYKFCLKYFSF